MRSSTTGRLGNSELPLIPAGNSQTNLNLTYDQTSTHRKQQQLKMNTNNRTNSRNTNSRAGYLDFNDHYLDHYNSNEHHISNQYQFNYLNNDNLDRLNYLHHSNNSSNLQSSDHIYGHHNLTSQLNLSSGRQLQEDDCRSIHQYEEPMNLIRPLPSAFTNFKNSNGLLNSLNRKYTNLQSNQQQQLSQQDNLHLEMASRKENNSENSDESVLSMESDMSDKRMARKNGASSSSAGSSGGNGQSNHNNGNFNGRNMSSYKFATDGTKDHLSELPNSSDCSLSKSNVDTVSSTVPGSTATLEADSRFMNLINSSNGSKYNKNTSIINYDNDRIYGLSSNNKFNGNPLDNLNYGSNLIEENIYNNGSAASTTSASNILIKTGTLSNKYTGTPTNHNMSNTGINLLNDLRNKSATLQSTANANQLNLYKHESITTGPLIPSNNTASLLTSQLLDNTTGTVYHTSALHPNFTQQNPSFKMLNSRFSFSLTKSCNSNQPCYWRLASLVLILICLLMVALFAYKQATSTSLLFNDESNKPCILVDDYSSGGQMPVFPPPQFLPKQQIQTNLPSYASTSSASNSGSFLSSSSSINSASSANPSTNHLSNNAHLVRLPTDPTIYKELQFNTDHSISGLNSQTAYLVEQIALNSLIAGKFQQQTGGLIKFSLKQLPIWARLAFFAKRNDPPTLTNHELVEFITADGSTSSAANQQTSKRRSSRSIFEKIVFNNEFNFDSLDNLDSLNRFKRSSLNSFSSSDSTISIEYLEYFEPGYWFFVLINDANHDQKYNLQLNVTKLANLQFSCPNDCSGHGLCEQGKCNCDTGFIGSDCSRTVCPVLCSGNGQYQRGKCKCNPNYFGLECENRRTTTCAQSERPCNNNGLCVAGHCVCNQGYSGDECELQDSKETCKPPKADDQQNSYESQLIKETNQKQKAHCLNGRCNDKGKCICSIGFMGRFCSLSACANNCSSNGQCLPVKIDQSTTNIISVDEDEIENDEHSIEYQCSCSADWTGADCSFRFERNCADDVDNDNDGLIDCADSECCAKDECKDSLMCLMSPDPLDIVLRKPAPSMSASFYQRTKFLIEEGSVQSYAHREDLSESRVSVIRGQIVTPDGNGLTGIRISVATDPQFGFSLTRSDGWFDILVNGGSMVTLQFQRSPFHPIKHSVQVAWNEILVMQSPIIMNVVANADDNQQNGNQHSTIYNNLNKNLNQNNSNYLHQQQYTLETIFWPFTSKSSNLRNKNNEQKHLSSSLLIGRNNLHRTSTNNSLSFGLHCWSHDYRQMQPLIINRLNKISKQGNLFDQSLITLEDRSLSESYMIAGSNLQLVYQSSSSPSYFSVLEIQLTPEKIPHDLALVHLRIVIEGNLFTKELEAKPLLRYSYAWNKRNVYKQKVYGFTTAKIYVGYEYEHCQHIIWTSLSTKTNGFQMDISEFANWNLQIHHRLNLNEKFIQLGTGGIINLQKDVYLKETYGKYGQIRRETACLDSTKITENCSSNLLQQPVSLTSGADGSLYIGDADLIIRLKPDGSSIVLFKFSSKLSNGQQFKATGNQAHSHVYYLQYSAYDGHLYLTDSERFQIIRLLSLDNVEQPESNFEIIAGNGLRCFYSEDVEQCGDGGLAIEAKLTQPKGIVFSADNSIYFADGTSVRRINRKGLIYTIVSANVNNHKLRPFNCDHLTDSVSETKDLKAFKNKNLLHSTKLSARKIKLNFPTQLAINPLNNLLYILDERHVIYELSADHRLNVVFGKPAHCSNYLNDLGLITSFVFTSSGDMFISLIQNGQHQIKLRTTDGQIEHYLGEQINEDSRSNLEQEQSHFEEYYQHLKEEFKMNSFSNYYDQLLSSHLSDCLTSLDSDECQAYVNYENLIYQNKTTRSRKSNKQFKINAITITGDNLLHIMDSANYQILSVKFNLDGDKQQFNILNSLTEELYTFNKHGLHLATLNALTGRTIYSFAYNQNTSSGKLISVTDSSNNKITFVRQQGKLTSILSANGQKCKVQINQKGQLEQIIEEDGLKTSYQYDSNGFLIRKSDNLGINYQYEYDRFGRLVSIIKPTGVRLDLSYRPSVNGASIYTRQTNLADSTNVQEADQLQIRFKPNGKHQHLFTNGVELSLSDLTDSNYLITNSFNQTVHLGRQPAQELISFQSANTPIQSSTAKQIIYSRTPMGDLQMKRTQITWEIDIKYKANRDENLNWRNQNDQQSDEIIAVERILSIDGNRILSIEYDKTANREILYNTTRRPFLLIQYDNSSSRPIQWLNLVDASNRMPLNVVYDRQSRLAGWQQGSKQSETFVYNRNGLLSEIKYPDMSSIKYIYDQNEDDSNRKQNDQLPANLKPTRIILRSGKEFYFKYDQKAGLKEIWTAKPGVKHQFKFSISLGFYKLHYCPPGFDFTNGYIVYFDDNLKPIMEQHLNAYSKVLYRYNQANNQLSEIVYGGGKVVHNWVDSNENNKLLASEYWLEGDDQVLITYTYKQSKLQSTQQILFNTIHKLFGLKFYYEYDNFSRKTLIKTSLLNSTNDQHSFISSLSYLYNDKTGKLEQFGPFKIIDHHDYLRKQNESLISDGVATFSKVYDSINHKLKQFTLSIRDKEVFRMIYTLNSNNAIVSRKRYVKMNNQVNLRISQTNFTYDLDEQLVEIKSEREHWRFSYDDNFNLIRIQYAQNAIEISIAKDRISNFGDTPYIYDKRGYLIRRGEELFTYNTFGLLVSINKLTKQHEINYLYDSRGRLAARIDNFGNRTQYIYGDTKNPQLLTHLIQFNTERPLNELQSSNRPLITSFIYDDSNLLIAYTTNLLNEPNDPIAAKQLFYVVCDQSGSPTHVFNQNGILTKELTRSPFGHILFDTNPSIYLPIGFHGAISEPLISIVFFGRYVYDTLVGQWLQPNFAQILNSGTIEPKYLSIYRYARNDPINLDLFSLTRTDRYDINKWIQHQGIDLSGFDLELSRFINKNDQHFSKLITNVEDVVYNYRRSGVQRKQVPSFNYGLNEQFDALSYNVEQIKNALPLPNIALSSDLLCKLTLNSMNFGKISFMKKSQLKSDQLLEPTKIERLHSEQTFGDGIALSRKRNGNLFVTSSADADQLKYSVYSKVLNDSELINLKQNKNGKDLFYFVKQDTVSVSEDLSELQKFGRTINVTINEVKNDRLESDSKSKVDIRIESSTAIINVRYGSNLKEEHERLFKHFKQQAIDDKLKQIQQELIELKRTQDQFSSLNQQIRSRIRSSWTEKEKETIITTGKLSTYTGEYYHDVQHYPELADDSSNIVFIKK